MEDCLVIGSGPSAAAVAHALVEQGRRVAIVDAGLRLEPGLAGIRDRLAATRPDSWLQEDAEAMRAGTTASSKGVPLKAVYGSDFARRVPPQAGPLDVVAGKLMRSFASGGLSNVWGACVLPYTAEDLAGWPIGESDLRPHYEAVRLFMPQAARCDGLAERHQMGMSLDTPLTLSRQAQALLLDLKRAAPRLHANGIHYGGSWLAVRNTPQQSCRHCGMCLYGCPYGLIYNSAPTVDRLVSSGRAVAYPGLMVDRLIEQENGVELHARRLADDAPVRLLARRVFAGMGVVETARLLLRSRELYGNSVRLMGSDRFLLPFLRFRGVPEVEKEALHTLCQIFVELEDPSLCERSVHLQIYTYNDLYRRVLTPRSRLLRSFARPPVSALLARLLIMNGYLPSSVSSHVRLTLRRAREALREAGVVPSGESRGGVTRVGARLWREWRAFGGLPSLPRRDPPGGGNHSGGTFPMRAKPGRMESDVLGRPLEYKRVHVVDASVFTSIAGSTIAFTAMANAHRIGTLAAKED